MKIRALVLTAASMLTLSQFANAAADAQPKVDCSKAKTGVVKITSTGKRLTAIEGATLAYKCLSGANPSLEIKRKAAIQKAKSSNDMPDQCGQSAELQTLLLDNWDGERPYPASQADDGNGLMGVSGTSTVLVREPITCDGIGSGVFSGIVSSVSATISIEESFQFSEADDSSGSQQITAKLEKLNQI